MKEFAAITTDPYEAGIEVFQFLRDIDTDTRELLSALVGSSTAFVKGGVITVDAGDTTVTNGIIFKDGSFYHFSGGTVAATLPDAINIKFETAHATGYPNPTIGISPFDLFKDKRATIDNAGAVVLSSISHISDLQYLKSKADLVDGKAGKNAYVQTTNFTLGSDFSLYYPGVYSNETVREYEDGTVQVSLLLLINNNNIPVDTPIISMLPHENAHYYPQKRPIEVFITSAGAGTGGAVTSAQCRLEKLSIGGTDNIFLVAQSGFMSKKDQVVFVDFEYKK